MTSSTNTPHLHIHLDPVGGIAGDMFIAAVIDAFPKLEANMISTIRAAGVPLSHTLSVKQHRDHALTGMQFTVGAASSSDRVPRTHSRYEQIRTLLVEATIPENVRAHALDIFALLAAAEARVHGVAIDDVTFHELGEWDSIADIVGSAYLLTALNAKWSTGTLPLGRGRVQSAHGLLPVPAPATVLLLEGFPCHLDGVQGERVTPTGAAILRHIDANGARNILGQRLIASGTGFGARRFPEVSNVLRVFVFEDAPVARQSDSVVEIVFDVDDQSPEDLAIGLGRLRAHEAVKDVIQISAVGKKGRMTVDIRVLADPAQLDSVIDACFAETTTIGLRYQLLMRAILPRRQEMVRVDDKKVQVKLTERSGGQTSKVESDVLCECLGGQAGRDHLRYSVAMALEKGKRQP